ncbi:MAG TPA: CARDB domain-containing protein, partial [Tahibacter sp.]|nr:CARDB domain-containing protein [Tahibacter sp.]
MDATMKFCGLVLFAAAGAAQAQSTYDYSYAVRLRTSPAGTTATLTRADGKFVYTNVALTPQGCPSGKMPTASRTTSVISYVTPRRLELRLPTLGGGSCVLVGSFVPAANDDPMRDPGPPGQITAYVPDRAELRAGPMLSIWPDTSGAWNGSIVVSSSDAVGRSSGACAFKYGYIAENVGDIASAKTVNTLDWTGPSSGSTDDDVPALAADAKTEIMGHIWLKPGLSTVTLYVDSPNLVEEKVETNAYEI